MGPHSFECGNADIKTDEELNIPLQWGRTRSSAEIAQAMPVECGKVAASMGPHSFECGNLAEMM